MHKFPEFIFKIKKILASHRKSGKNFSTGKKNQETFYFGNFFTLSTANKKLSPLPKNRKNPQKTPNSPT